MPDTGWLIANSGTNVNFDGGFAWTTPDNIISDDAATAIASSTNLVTSQYLVSGTHGALLPAGATVDGVEVRADVVTLSGTGAQMLVGLTKDGTNTLFDPSALTGPGLATRGGPTSLWGFGSLTEAEVEASTFGAVFVGDLVETGFGNYEIDAVWVKVYYTASVPGVSVKVR